MNKWFVYVITSEEGLTYTGITHNIEKRLAEHNEGRSNYTKRGTNWRIVYREEFETRTEARKREKYFKNNAGKEWLRRRGIL
ncbi:MAG: GIY-YIG nuclease family protein [Candidatus Marinimicrobia bacterium]|nr:GIY-YIG nuclease family protein [Candidatus Neomarinimicrobiota bacterium]